MTYWQVTTQFERENDRGRIQKVKEIYLVDAMGGTEAESKVYKYLENEGEREWEGGRKRGREGGRERTRDKEGK